MLAAASGKLYAVDLVAIAALRRSLTQSASFRLLIEKRHFPSAAVLLRTQLDSALRFSAFWNVANPDALARDIIRGIPVRDHIDLQGKKLTDARLVQLQTEDSDWVPEVYEKASGFVHLSESHLAHAFSAPPGDDSSFHFFIGIEDEDIEESTYLEAIAAFDAATDLLLEYVERWTKEKSSGTGIAKDLNNVGQAPDPKDIVRDAPT